ncbi:phage portal protein [Mycobacterium arosiense]|uniref:phage portal protein n=1 Tax=Mycobacterium arosiense TaxID=425468 RepID=UPI0009F49758|nr:phage portal protein [Mycobacterium arosiense]
MTTPDVLADLLQTLDAPQPRYQMLSRWYEGLNNQLHFIEPESREALGNKLERLSINLCRLSINSIVERLRVCGFEGDSRLWEWFEDNELDIESASAHREALLYGSSWAFVWVDSQGSPNVTIESSRNVAAHIDPGTREITECIKRYYSRGQTHCWLYLPDVIQQYVADSVGANTDFQLVKEIANPLGTPPVAQFRNPGRIHVPGLNYPERANLGTSEIHDLIPINGAIDMTVADALVTSNFCARPRRYISGIPLTEVPRVDQNGTPVLDANGEQIIDTVNPIPEGARMIAVEDENGNVKIGQLPAADLAGYESLVKVLMAAAQATSALPSNYLGILTDQPASADAYRAEAAGLTARSEEKAKAFGKTWDRVARLMIAVADGVPVESVKVRTKWGPADYRSIAEESDAMVKLSTPPLYSRETALAKLGMSADEIEAEINRLDNDQFSKEYSQLSAITKATSQDRGING